MILTVSVPLDVDDSRVFTIMARGDGRYDVRYLDALGAQAVGIAESPEVAAYHGRRRRTEEDARMAAGGMEGA